MDPEAKLEELRKLAAEIITLQDAFGETQDAVRALERISEKADELAQGFQALDEWLKKGSFLPNDWKRQSSALGLIEEKRRLFPDIASHLDDIESVLVEDQGEGPSYAPFIAATRILGLVRSNHDHAALLGQIEAIIRAECPPR